MRLFELRRDVDETGISGTGTVAQGVIFDNGWCVMVWPTKHTSAAFYTDLSEVIAIHGHNGKTRVVQIADCDMNKNGGARHLVTNMIQDNCEGIGVEFHKGNAAYMWEQREKFADLFKELDLATPAHGHEKGEGCRKCGQALTSILLCRDCDLDERPAPRQER